MFTRKSNSHRREGKRHRPTQQKCEEDTRIVFDSAPKSMSGAENGGDAEPSDRLGPPVEDAEQQAEVDGYRQFSEIPEDGGPKFEGSREHLAILRQGRDAWNAWREENPEEWPSLIGADLSKVDLSRANLSGAELYGADLSGADLRGADLSGADLFEANLSGVDLEGANLSGAELYGADLSGADLRQANLSGAKPFGADLSGADLYAANLSGAHLFAANLSGADLRWADLSGADLRGADLSRADLFEANLQGADLVGAKMRLARLEQANFIEANLRGVRNLRLDQNRIFGAQFDPDARDPWSVLRRTYSGPRLIMNLILMGLFFVPMLVSTAALWGYGQVSEGIGGAVGAAQSLTAQCAQGSATLWTPLAPLPQEVACETRSTISVLLGAANEGAMGVMLPWLTLAAIAYQATRFWLTGHISRLRDEEERSHVSPPYEVPRTKTWLGRLVPGPAFEVLEKIPFIRRPFSRPTSGVPAYPLLFPVHLINERILLPIVIVALLFKMIEFAGGEIIQFHNAPAGEASVIVGETDAG